ncbi:transcriptional regulator [Chitinophaga dinghuensis]|uniref:Transcriptional regulator n=1 Tax=Chitinophaga dinghuensis TaxID=1539050 RepID=A0A327WES8_9BACT|nr:FMN-binding negative transcriptional regulator [Chitinophaga dinghuensis]RAJ87860.1 transcriptional regulator [Chitinophaga dinghuensis]
MYTSKLNRETDWNKIEAFMREFSFAMVVDTDEHGVPQATHLPLTLKQTPDGKYVLQGHIAKINKQWEYFGKQDTLVVFSTPHAYISSSWYEKDKIPTWNYMVVHVHGKTRILSEQELIQNLDDLMQHYEAASQHPVNLKDIDEKTLISNLKAIVGFEIEVRDINANYKLSGNKKDADFFNIIKHLREKNDQESHRIADEMEARRPVQDI